VKIRPGIRAAALAIPLATSALAALRLTAGDLNSDRSYRSETGRFSVDFPGGSPTVRELTGSKFSMTDNDVNYAVVSDGVEYSVEIHDIPRVARLVLTSHYILEHSVSGKLEDINARVVDAAETYFQGEPAREVGFEAPDRAFTGRMLLVLAGSRLYLVGILHPPSIDPEESAAQFFESFSFWLE